MSAERRAGFTPTMNEAAMHIESGTRPRATAPHASPTTERSASRRLHGRRATKAKHPRKKEQPNRQDNPTNPAQHQPRRSNKIPGTRSKTIITRFPTKGRRRQWLEYGKAQIYPDLHGSQLRRISFELQLKRKCGTSQKYVFRITAAMCLACWRPRILVFFTLTSHSTHFSLTCL